MSLGIGQLAGIQEVWQCIFFKSGIVNRCSLNRIIPIDYWCRPNSREGSGDAAIC